jgi:hypothetical protein
VERGEGLLVELELLPEGVDLVRTHEAALLRMLDEGGDRRICIKGISAQGKFSQHHFSEGCSGLGAHTRYRGTRRLS